MRGNSGSGVYGFDSMTEDIYDLAVIGGGINGVGIAVDAQGRGLKTTLIEKRDLASGTSSSSSKLVHGGLRYLEQWEFRLVRESLREREILLYKAPHLVEPMRFVLPHSRRLRPAWMIRLGLWLYDVLAKRDRLPASRAVRFTPETSPLKSEFTRGFEYSDCWVDDARLVVMNAVQCRQLGGDIFTGTECLGIDRDHREGAWKVRLRDSGKGGEWSIRARGVVNAAGPWVNTLVSGDTPLVHHRAVKLVRGSHIVLPRLYAGDRAHILQNDDGRVVFVIPYLEDFTLVGTTDVSHDHSADEVAIAREEAEYLCTAVNRYFRVGIDPGMVVWDYAGVRALFDDHGVDPQALSRDYSLAMTGGDGPPFLTVYGGKLTTYRKLAETAVDKLAKYYPQAKPPWTESSILPGGDMGMSRDDFSDKLARDYPFLTAKSCRRLAAAYGSRVRLFLAGAGNLDSLGEHFGEQFTEAELTYLVDEEFARSPEDVLWRRTKLGLRLTAAQQRRVTRFLDAYLAGSGAEVAGITGERVL